MKLSAEIMELLLAHLLSVNISRKTQLPQSSETTNYEFVSLIDSQSCVLSQRDFFRLFNSFYFIFLMV